ncbi:uncharacterized protein LOC123545478 isoform X1 [Mercenaria mercenaria]|uniref:uncharacterized protein LOC123545478 isoform X1 n=1 Tax=Mercenaria mercenaria TaxID=6596 RepID=UPI00234E7477|nr:uncharacterized protein LOC123545478 isoform X1 [Mercenaria mercenaria]
MGKKSRKQCSLLSEITSSDKTPEDVKKRLKEDPNPSWLPPGSLSVRTKTKRSWKEKCMILREENKKLTEKVQKYEDEHHRLQEISRDHASRLVQFDSSENVQIGNHNFQVVNNNFDATFLNHLLDQYEDKIEKDARQRQSMKGTIQELSTKIEELTQTHKRSEKLFDCSKLMDHLHELHTSPEQEMACPVSSIALIYKETTEMFKSVAPEITRLQENMKSLRTYIDEPKSEFLFAPCLSHRSRSTVSFDEARLLGKDEECKCQRIINSDLCLNTHL